MVAQAMRIRYTYLDIALSFLLFTLEGSRVWDGVPADPPYGFHEGATKRTASWPRLMHKLFGVSWQGFVRGTASILSSISI